MRSFEVRAGAIAGWIGLVGVTILFIVGPSLIAGQPPTVASNVGDVMAYFGHPELGPIYGVLGPLVVITAILPFGIGLRAALRREAASESTNAFADYGLAFLVVAAPVYAVSGAMVAGLVEAAGHDPATLAILFREYDVLYDAAADVLEGAWIGAFSVAMLGGGFPRWIGWLGVVVGLSRWLKAFAPFVPALVPIALPGGLLFLAWFLGTVVGLTRLARLTRVSGTQSTPLAAAS